jgi:hypothetical protein
MAPRHGAGRNATPTGPGVELGDRFQSALQTLRADQNAPYLAATVIVMFLAGWVVVNLRDRLRKRDRWFSPCGRKSDRPPRSER